MLSLAGCGRDEEGSDSEFGGFFEVSWMDVWKEGTLYS